MLDKELQEQNEKVASKDDFPINWIDRVSLFLSHAIKYLIPIIVLQWLWQQKVIQVTIKKIPRLLAMKILRVMIYFKYSTQEQNMMEITF